MKLLLIITDYGSFNNFLSEVAVRLTITGNEVHVICSSVKVIDYQDKYPYTGLGIKFHYIDFPRSFNLFKQLAASKKINKKIAAINPDLINIHFTTGIFTTVLWKKPAFFTIGTIHGVGYPIIKGKLKKKIFEAIEKFCFKRLDQIYLLNNVDYNLLKNLYPRKSFKYNSCGVGCDLQKFNPDKITIDIKTNLRHSLSINPNDFVLAFTGRFVAFKGFDLVIKAMIALMNDQNNSTTKLILIGGKDPAHKYGLNKDEENFYKNSKQIIRVGFTADVNLYLAISNLFVFPSEKEGMPVCIMEALAMGLPVITSNTRGCNDLIENNFNGILLSDSPSVSEVKSAILELYQDNKLLKKLSANALSKRAEYSRERYINDQIMIYTNVIKADL